MSAGAAPRPGGGTILRLQRGVLLGGLVATTALCWLYLLRAPADAGMPGMEAPAGLGVILPMWAIMMVGMMLPTAVPMILTYAAASGRNPRGHLARTVVFVLAYLALWALFSVAGATMQVQLRAAGLLTHMGASSNAILSGTLLLVAGGYQLSPLKRVCLRRCRSPLAFLLTDWRPGVGGALRMGLRHGTDCVMCCWALMALAFVVGTMSVPWMAALMLLMIAEKVLPGGQRIGAMAGVALIGWATLVLASAASTAL